MNLKLLSGLAIVLCVFSLASATAQLNETERIIDNPDPVATGQESIPVVTANGSNVAEAAPADAIASLLTTIFTVAVPAVTGLIVAVFTLIKQFSKDKRVQENSDRVITTAKYVDTMAPKINDSYVASGAFKTGFDLIADALEEIRPGTKTKIAEALKPLPDAEVKVRAASAQMDKLRSQLPDAAIADNDKSLGELERRARVAST